MGTPTPPITSPMTRSVKPWWIHLTNTFLLSHWNWKMNEKKLMLIKNYWDIELCSFDIGNQWKWHLEKPLSNSFPWGHQGRPWEKHPFSWNHNLLLNGAKDKSHWNDGGRQHFGQWNPNVLLDGTKDKSSWNDDGRRLSSERSRHLLECLLLDPSWRSAKSHFEVVIS